MIYSFRGRRIRSPFEILATEEEVKRFKNYINHCGITSFLIEEIVDNPIVKFEEPVFKIQEEEEEEIQPQILPVESVPCKENNEIKIEELSFKSKSTLESFMNIEFEKRK